MADRMTNFFTGVREAWSLAKPYFSSEERWTAWGLLIAVIALNLLIVAMNVVITYWNNDFYNAIQAYDSATCIRLLYYPIIHIKASPVPILGFAELIAAYVLIATYAIYLGQMLQIKWRQWLTTHYVENWLADRAYYTISLRQHPGQIVDNPDQRIAEDLRDFTANTLTLGIDFITNLVTLFSFVFVLYSVSGIVHWFGFTIHGYLVWVALGYSLVGTIITQLIGRKMIPLSFNQQRLEANFRYRLIRVRDNPEAIALARGESEANEALSLSFVDVRDNFWSLMRRNVPLNFFTNGFAQIANIFPLVVILPRYFAKQIGFGALAQIPIAFSQVQGALSWFINNYTAQLGTNTAGLVTWRATISRLYGFREAMDAARAATAAGPRLTAPGADLRLENLTLTLPDGRKLLNGASLTLPPGEKITITGPSGAGKSTLFRAIAGIWPFGEGSITPPSGSLLFLPQKPYFPLGSLKRSLAYPHAEESITDDAATEALTALGLAQLAPHLHDHTNWGLTLSGGEQQRLALARAILAKPDWLFLDEASSALDPALAAQVQTTLTQHLPNTTIVAISHHDTPATRHLQLADGDLASV
jgi:putative ATP-binding cassette transporter